MNIGKRVLILGASRYYSKCIEMARKAGYYVISIDRAPDSDGFKYADESYVCDIIDKEAVLELSIKCEIDGIIPINDYGVPTAAYVASKLSLPGISEAVASNSTSKDLMRRRWIEAGVPCPKVALAETREEFIRAIDEVGIPCILKPANGYGGASRGVITVHSISELDDAIAFAQKFYKDKKTLVETFVDATVEHSVELIVEDGEPYILAIADKIKSPLPYRVDKNVIYPTCVEGESLSLLKEVVIKAVEAIGISVGAVHVEVASTPDGPILFELGARTGGGGTSTPIIPWVTGIDYFLEVVRVLTGGEIEKKTPTENRACNYHFITPKPGELKSISGLKEVENSDYVLDFEFFGKPGDTIKEVQTGLDRSGFIIVGHEDSRDSALQIGQSLEAAISLEYVTD